MNGSLGAGRALPGATAEWPRRVDLTRLLAATPTAGRGAIPVIRDHGTSDLVPPFADPHGTLQLAVQILHGLGPDQPPEGKPDGDDGNEGGHGLGELFEVLGQATISAEP